MHWLLLSPAVAPYRPAGHGAVQSRDDRLSTSPYRPGAQGVQEDRPVLFAVVPRGHGMGFTAPVGQYDPGGHSPEQVAATMPSAAP